MKNSQNAGTSGLLAKSAHCFFYRTLTTAGLLHTPFASTKLRDRKQHSMYIHTAQECPGGTGNKTTYSGGEGRLKAKFKAW